MSGYGPFADHYDVLTGNVDYAARAQRLHTLIKKHGGEGEGLLLDLACGTGSLSLEMAQRGYDVIGVDASPAMLTQASAKAAAASRQILFLSQSMEELDLYGTVRNTVCILDSLNHLPDESALDQAIARVSLFTDPGGLFLFDLNTPYKHRSILGDNVFVYEPGDLFCIWQNTYSERDHRVRVALDFFTRRADGTYTRTGERFTERIFPHHLVESLLAEHNFALLETLDGDRDAPPSETSQRLLYVAKKQ